MPNSAPDYNKARKNMVDCQIHTSGVVHTGLLNAFETVPREMFVPEHLKGIAYYDEEIDLGKGRTLLDPLTLSKMLQAADLKESDVVLDIGGATGYGAAILSPIVSTIIAAESNQEFLDKAQNIWNELGANNIVPVHAKPREGANEDGPYNVIVMHGAVPEIPKKIAAHLVENGRLFCIIKKPGDRLGQATMVQSLGENQFSSYTLFECAANYIDGFAPKPAFSF